MNVTDLLSGAVRQALDAAGLPVPDEVAWEIPREAHHGDYATNVAMTLARTARRPPRQVAEAIVARFPSTGVVERLEVAGPGFLNVFLASAWCASALRDVLRAGDGYGRRQTDGRRYRIEFVSANPTGPLVIVNARAAAVGDALARILRSQGADVVSEYYVNDAGNQFQALAASMEARVRQALGQDAALPENGYPGDYLVELARDWLAKDRAAADALLAQAEEERRRRFGWYAVHAMVAGQK